MRATARLFVATLIVVCLATYAAVAAHGFAWGVDDAHISFVYASHLAQGHGFVFNVGGERVEGFSSLLWVLLTAPTFYLPGRPEIWILALTTVLTSLSYTVAARFLVRSYAPVAAQVPPSLAATLYVGLLIAWPAHVTWMSASLMETALWSVLLTVAAALILWGGAPKGSWHTTAFSTVLALMLLTRPESMLLCPALILLRLARLAALEDWRRAMRLTIAPVLVTLLTASALTIFRLWYFGYPLPNTYYAKVPPSWAANLRDGLSYLNAFVSSGPLLVLIFFLNVAALALMAASALRSLRAGTLLPQARRALSSDAVVLVWISCVLLILPVLNGGDHFGWWRMYQPAYPVLLLTVFIFARDGVALTRLRAGPVARVVVAAIVLTFGLFRFYDRVTWLKVRDESPIEREFRIGREGVDGGELLSRMFSGEARYPSVAVVTAGGIKRTYRGEVQDLMGLNATAMAHNGGDRLGIKHHAAFDKEVFFTWQPEIVWPVPEPMAPSLRTRDFVRVVLRGLPDDPRFLDLYEEAALHHTLSGDRGVTAFFRKDFLARLSRDPVYAVTKVK